MASEEAEAAAPSAFEVWNDYDPSMRFVTAYPMSAAQGTESSTVAYYAFEPGQHSGLHADDAEELIYVADGEGEVFVSGVQQKLEAGGFVLRPQGRPARRLRLRRRHAAAAVVLPERPRREHVTPRCCCRSTATTLASDMAVPGAMPQIEEIDFDDLPPGLAESSAGCRGRRRAGERAARPARSRGRRLGGGRQTRRSGGCRLDDAFRRRYRRALREGARPRRPGHEPLRPSTAALATSSRAPTTGSS